MVGFYLLTFSRFQLRKKEHKSCDKNRTLDFRTSRCTGYLLDHSGDEGIALNNSDAHAQQPVFYFLCSLKCFYEAIFTYYTAFPEVIRNEYLTSYRYIMMTFSWYVAVILLSSPLQTPFPLFHFFRVGAPLKNLWIENRQWRRPTSLATAR